MISIYKLQNVLPYCLIKQVNKILGIRNSEIWLFDDVSKIKEIISKNGVKYIQTVSYDGARMVTIHKKNQQELRKYTKKNSLIHLKA